jgi:hypothetical protein
MRLILCTVNGRFVPTTLSTVSRCHADITSATLLWDDASTSTIGPRVLTSSRPAAYDTGDAASLSALLDEDVVAGTVSHLVATANDLCEHCNIHVWVIFGDRHSE